MNTATTVPALPVVRPRRRKPTSRRKADPTRVRTRRHRRAMPLRPFAASVAGVLPGWGMPGTVDAAFEPHSGMRLIDPGFDEVTVADLVASLPALASTSLWRGAPADPTGPRA